MNARNLLVTLVTCLVFLHMFTWASGSFMMKKKVRSSRSLSDSAITYDPFYRFQECEGICVDDGEYCCDCDICRRPCFPATSKVSVENGKSIAMSDLQIGDKVKTVSSDGTVMYGKVTGFLKKQHTSINSYMSIKTSGNQTISLSGSHLIFTRKSAIDKFKPILADQVLIGDEVLVQGNYYLTSAKIISTSSFKMQGAYVPLTMEGNIVVDGVLSSCYDFFDHDLVHFAMMPIQRFPDILGLTFGEENGL